MSMNAAADHVHMTEQERIVHDTLFWSKRLAKVNDIVMQFTAESLTPTQELGDASHPRQCLSSALSSAQGNTLTCSTLAIH